MKMLITRRDCGCIMSACPIDPRWQQQLSADLGYAQKAGLSTEEVSERYVMEIMKLCTHRADRRRTRSGRMA